MSGLVLGEIVSQRTGTLLVAESQTYHGDDFGLDGLIQGDEAKVENEVELVNCEQGLF